MIRLVTGAHGFIGRHLVSRLAAESGGEIHVLTRPQSPSEAPTTWPRTIEIHRHNGSTRDLAVLLERLRPDTVFHLASLAISEHGVDHVVPLIESNLLFPTQLLEAMGTARGSRLINMGSAWQSPHKRTGAPSGLYGATKEAFKAIIAFYAKAHKMPAVTLKPFHVYGPGDLRPRLIPQLIDAARSGKPLPMTEGRQAVDLLYIDDLIDALLHAERLLEEAYPGSPLSFALSSGRWLSVREVAALFERVTGVRLNLLWGALAYKEHTPLEPFELGAPLPGWRAKISLEEGIERIWSVILAGA